MISRIKLKGNEDFWMDLGEDGIDKEEVDAIVIDNPDGSQHAIIETSHMKYYRRIDSSNYQILKSQSNKI